MSTEDRAAARRVTAALRGAGTDVVHVSNPTAACDLIDAAAVDLALVDGDHAANAIVVLDAARGKVPAVVVSSSADAAELLDFVCSRDVAHFLSRPEGEPGDDALREIVTTVEKILRADLFGIEKYLPGFGTEIASAEVRGAADRDGVVECIVDHLDWLGAPREAARAAAAIADELITNAVYDAPRDARGRARYAACNRREKIQLDPWEYVQVRWGSNGDVLAIAVTDPFGSLHAEHLRSGLRRCLLEADPIEQKAGGAGLGLYTALSYSRQLIVNVDRGVRTEIIALIDLRRRAAGARRGGGSLHLFFDDSRSRVVESWDATPSTIVVSESLRVELRERVAPAKKARAELVPLTDKRPAEPLRARGSTPPPCRDPVGAGTACGLLRGATDADTAVTVGLRFLSQHYRAAIAYAVGDTGLEARLTGGSVEDWDGLRGLRVAGDASVTRLCNGKAAGFLPSRPLDYQQALLACGDSQAAGLTVPLRIDGELRWILYAAAPRIDAPVTPATVEVVRSELERCLERLDPEWPMIEIAR